MPNEIIWPAGWHRDPVWHLEQITAPDLDADVLTLAMAKEHLHVTHDAEDDAIRRLIRTSYRVAERATRRALMTQTWAYVADRFPVGCVELLLPKPPLQAVESIEYLDSEGVLQTWDGSPLPYAVSIPSGPQAGSARIRPVVGTVWPIARYGELDAVTVTFRAGYPESDDSPASCAVPEDITHGRLLYIAELYKQRSESVLAPNHTPAQLRSQQLWDGYRVYGA